MEEKTIEERLKEIALRYDYTLEEVNNFHEDILKEDKEEIAYMLLVA